MNTFVLLFSALCIISQAQEQNTVPCNEFKLRNGRMRLKTKGKLARFQCNSGYTLAGEKYSYCVRGKFDVPPPTCVKPTCSKMKPLANGVTLGSHNGAVVHFYCKPGFALRGPDKTFCDGKKWTNPLPSCLGTNVPTPTSCDFSSTDLCGWSPDLNHDFDWQRHQHATPSGHVGTGPRFDHTTRTGWYMYTEATSRLEGDVARLVSPIWRVAAPGCFTLWYHMKGRDIGGLKVYMAPVGLGGKGRLLWEIYGEQGDQWKQAKVELGLDNVEDLQIIIEGVRGKSYISDIAIDDVALLETCPADEDMSTTETWTVEGELAESCLNRCGDMPATDTDSETCSCHDGCYENNSCCPDYTAICLIASIDEYFTDTSESSTTSETETSTTEIETTTYLHTTQQDLTTLFSIYNTTSYPTINLITETPTTKTSIPTTSTTKETTVASVTNPPTQSTKVTNPVEIETTVPETVRTISTTIHSKYPTRSNTFTTKTATINVVETTTSGLDMDTIDIETDYEPEMPGSRIKTPVAHASQSTGNTPNFWVWAGVATVVLAAAVAVALGVLVHRRRHRRRHGDSMSDVRFLASDEVLDFTWRTSSD